MAKKRQTAAPTAQSTVVSIEDQLRGAGLEDGDLELLRNARMLNANVLSKATTEQLVGNVGLVLGAALAVKEVFPNPSHAVPASQPTGQPNGWIPPEIKVNVAAPAVKINEMDADQLLDVLVGNASNEAALRALYTQPEVLLALKKGPKIAVLAEDNKTFSKPRTTSYWTYLRKGTPQTRWQGGRVVTLDKAFGRVERVMFHPLFDGQKINMGIDAWGRDYTKVDTNLFEAVLWARTSKPAPHQMFPQIVDPIKTYEELVEKELDERWEVILDDYMAQIEDFGRVNVVTTEEEVEPESGDTFLGIRRTN